MILSLEQQVCNKELSRRLKELGIEQDSYFYWLNEINTNDYFLGSEVKKEHLQEKDYSAFTVAELGGMLPCDLRENEIIVYETYTSIEDKKIHSLGIRSIKNRCSCFMEHDNNEANARAKMLIYLLENKIIKHNN